MTVLRYRVQGKINDGLRDAPPIEIEVDPDAPDSWQGFATELAGELMNDEDIPFPIGATLTVERIA